MNLSKIRQAQAHVEELDQLYHSTIASLAMAIDAKDQSTHGHVQRVQTLTLGLARRCGIREEGEIKGLRAAALLHDIGKLAVPEYILNKPGPLTDAEMQKMRAHPVVGADILDTVPFPYPVTPYVRHHHERWDGKGYPDGLKADEIPLGARILAIVDCYDALRSDRPYRPSWDKKTTLDYIQGEAGKSYDPTIVEVMVESIEELEEEIQAVQGAIPKQVLETLEDSLNQLREDESSKIRNTVFHDIASTHKAVQAVYELSRSIGQSLNVRETLKLLASSIKQFVPYSACSIYLVNSRDDRVLPHFVSGMYRDILEGLEVKLGEGITGWAAANNKTLVNVSPAPEFLNLEQLRAVFKSCLAVPLSIDNSVVGVITLYSNEERVYKTDHLNLMETVAPHAASAINNAIIHEETREDAYTDLLTGLPNLRYLNSFIHVELARAERMGYHVTILMMDLERFKAVNDEHGHRAGDRVLVEFSRILRERLRMSDICIRYGGDEFVGILPGINREMAHEMILRIQNSVESHPIRIADDHFIHIGVSVGSANYPLDGVDHYRLLNLADRTMYENKLLRAQKGYGSQILPFEKRSDNG
jgi:diguanylate cyclase (GGDEF)-like protein/putative nucleotidyltransferase with HDIG domain